MVDHEPALPAGVLDDVAEKVGSELTGLRRLSGGANGGAMRVQLGGAPAVLKVAPRTHPDDLGATSRARRVVEHMRGLGYPTPAWLGVGATNTHVWHLMDFVDATPATELTSALVEQLMDVIELQAGQATESYDHWSYAWRLATGQDHGRDLAPDLTAAIRRLPGHSSAVSALVERLRAASSDAPPPTEASDMVHTDLNPGNILVRDGTVVAVVDIGNAGSGTRATDLMNLVWQSYSGPMDGARERLWTQILALVGGEGAAVMTATQILVNLEVPVRHGRHDLVPDLVERGHRALDELDALR